MCADKLQQRAIRGFIDDTFMFELHVPRETTDHAVIRFYRYTRVDRISDGTDVSGSNDSHSATFHRETKATDEGCDGSKMYPRT